MGRVLKLLVPLGGQCRLESRNQGGGKLNWDKEGWDKTNLGNYYKVLDMVNSRDLCLVL